MIENLLVNNVFDKKWISLLAKLDKKTEIVQGKAYKKLLFN